ncbi:MAG: 4Fe-4S binding protein [Clostridiales bacterium]|nr:4Fe-4S binding protein [Clostridiales bacterium]
MSTYIHSVSLDASKCTGCTTCMKHCPTEAIRIKDNCACIDAQRCIDCAQCIRHCPNHAKKSNYSSLSEIQKYKYKIALPAPALMAQFENLDSVDIVLQGLLDVGFDDVFEVARGAEIVSAYTRSYLATPGIKKPVLSTACPVIARLVMLRFPFLKDNLIPLLPPIEIAADLAVKEAKEKHPELRDEDICTCFISPCPAKVSYIKNGFGSYKSKITLAVSMSEVYMHLLHVMKHDVPAEVSARAGRVGLSWAMCGGEASALLNDKIIAADGIDNVISVLDQIEDGNISNVDFVELNACPGGCVGGVMALENPFIAKNRLHTIRRYMPVTQENIKQFEGAIPDSGFTENLPDYKPLNKLSDNIAESMRLMNKIQLMCKELPGIDCGSCGAPNCRAFAEDVVRGLADRNDCIIAYRDYIKDYINNYPGSRKNDG